MGIATQAKIRPCCMWVTDRTEFLLKRTSPFSNLQVQLPHLPLPQEYGASIPAFSMADSKGTCLFHGIWYVVPLMVTVTLTLSDALASG